ncbi:GNAT family N-acetyltransferase [Persicitalea jodogahamensis]|uniref:N-acetyltransferase n=1 Tax=Persicitalea jodogahamensis TaxID=402147 RepID=A0A8J3D882_9BACT|nr:GNAT family N-acetyltransferase [Persicitalea jodogahamensis]GHB66896.1 N-acetyltransferase [Persicitalea jodogahamensis]
MKITNSTKADIPEIFRLYAEAAAHQAKVGATVVWPTFERQLVATEISEKRQWKMMIEEEIACVWAITFEDEQIWEERNADPAIYIHRIATNPDFRGQNFVTRIVDWAKVYAQSRGKEYVRLDTIGENLPLIQHYTKAGFNFLGMFQMKNTDGLPAHYESGEVALFEIKL